MQTATDLNSSQQVSPEEAIVSLRDLRFRWGPRDPVVLDIPTLAIHRGEHVFIRGPSGSGKTTLLNLLGGVVAPQSGCVEVLGHDLGAMSGSKRDAFRADRIGFVFQQFNLIPYLGLMENVILPCRFSALRRARAGDVEAEARRLLGRMRIDVDALAGRPVSRLSIGVSIQPGRTSAVRTPNRSNSRDSASVRPFTANFDAE